MKISGAKIELIGRLLRRKDGALVKNSGGGILLDPTEEIYPQGYPQNRPPLSHAYGSKEYNDRKEWEDRYDAWRRRAFASEEYFRASQEFVERQRSEPCSTDYGANWWAYQYKIYYVEADGLDLVELALLIKHFALRQEQSFKRMSREIQAFENLERMTHREVIPESVRIFVWQRDGGKCVECGRRDSLEFDHIIPLAEGGASTERNVQLRCTPCNQRKGKNV